jgi:hypothetical protein
VTVTSQASAVMARSEVADCPPWCGSHPLPSNADGAHELDLARIWGDTPRRRDEERLSLALERYDDEVGRGEPQIVVQYSKDGDFPGGFIELSVSAAKNFMNTMGWLIAQAEDEQSL